MELSVSVRFSMRDDRGATSILLARWLERPGQVYYTVEGLQRMKALFEDAMLEPLLALFESGDGIVGSSTLELTFEASPHPRGLLLRAIGDEENDFPTLILTRHEAREIARVARIVLGVASPPPSYDRASGDHGARSGPMSLSMELDLRVRFLILEDDSNSSVTFWRAIERPGEIRYFGLGGQDVTACFEDAMLEPLLALFESGEGVVRSSTSELAFEATPHQGGIRMHATGDDENDPSSLVLSHDEAREIARVTRIVFGATSG